MPNAFTTTASVSISIRDNNSSNKTKKKLPQQHNNNSNKKVLFMILTSISNWFVFLFREERWTFTAAATTPLITLTATAATPTITSTAKAPSKVTVLKMKSDSYDNE